MKATGRKSVLIVDDDTFFITALNHILRPDYSVYVAKDGGSAIKQAIKEQPDVILLDVLMSGLDGYDVITELKSSERTWYIPIIVIGGFDSVRSADRGLALGAADYLAKPFHISTVKTKVKTQITLNERVRQRLSEERELRSSGLARSGIGKIERTF